MRFISVTADAFGPLNDSGLVFAPGLNVVYGPNESGKSSWHAAIYAGLCGIRRGAGQTKGQKRFKERFKPWDTNRWAVAITLALDGNGKAPREITLHHDLLGRVEASATDSLGRDVSNEIINGGSPDGSKWLGLDRDAFLATAAVRQADTLAVLERAEELQGYLQRAAASIGGEQTAAAAIDAIDEYRKENVGSTRANSRRPLRLALNAVDDARRFLESAREQHRDYMRLHSEADADRKVLQEAEAQVRVAEAAQCRQKLSVLEEKLGRATELTARFPDGEPQSTEHLEGVVAAVVNALAMWKAKPAIPELDGETADALGQQLAELPDMPVGDRRVDPAVREAQLECQRLAQDLRAHDRRKPDISVSPFDEVLSEAELLDMANRLEEPEPIVDPELAERPRDGYEPDRAPNWVRSALAFSVAGAAAGVVLMFLVSPAVGGAVLAAAFLAALVAVAPRLFGTDQRRELGDRRAEFETRRIAQQVRREDFLATKAAVEGRARDLGVSADPEELRRLAEQVRQNRDAVRQAAVWSEEHDTLEAEVADARALLARMLSDKGIVSNGDPEGAFDHYQSECDRREDQAQLASRSEALEAQLRAREQLELQVDSAERSVADALEAMSHLVQEIGLEMSDDGDAVAEHLRRWEEKQEQVIARSRQLDRDWTQLQELLGDDTLDGLLTEKAEFEGRVLLYEDVPVENELAICDERDLDETLQLLRRNRAEAVSRASAAQGRLEQLGRSLPSVPDAEDDLADAQHELVRVQALDTILDQTREYLAAAKELVFQEIAPVLNNEIAGRVAAITNHRYSEVRIDPRDLSIQVRASGGQWRDARNLSEGTREQIYLLLRVAMAKHVTDPSEACPLLLDDVTVQSDSARTIAVMDTLKSISEDHQVIMFTQEDEVLQWARANLGDPRHRVVELDPSRITA